MKSKEELNALKEKAETASKKTQELTDEELEQVVGGAAVNDIRVVEKVNPNPDILKMYVTNYE